MTTNTRLSREFAIKLIKKEEVLCPKCGKAVLISRRRDHSQNTIYKCPECSEVYRPYKLI